MSAETKLAKIAKAMGVTYQELLQDIQNKYIEQNEHLLDHPFDLDRALKGDKVVTREGDRAYIIKSDLKNEHYPLVVVVEGKDGKERVAGYTNQGWLHNAPNMRCSRDLRMDESAEEEVPGLWVDLGLPSGLLWASHNVGATNPEDYGEYFAWGETEPEYTKENSKTSAKSLSDISGDARYDVARARWGDSWRMPTKSELEELEDKCQWQWTTVNWIKGYKVAGPNGNSIFLPAAGYRSGSGLYDVGLDGSYWSSTPNEDNDGSAYYLFFNVKGRIVNWFNRYYGQSVRPVKEKKG